MGSFTFKWEHPADEVYVTGTFDDWTKSVKLEKTGDVFSKTVDLKDASSKIYYKFVVDGNWVINQSAPNEPDTQGNVNNFLTPDQITQDTHAAILNTVTPTSTTAAMASEQPIEVKPVEEKALNEKVLDEKVAEDKAVAALTSEETLTENEKAHPLETPSDIPGGFPTTPATELDKPVTVAPLANELEKPISVNPLPASEGVGNPITLAPGEKIPESITAQSTDKYVKLDKESYEKSDAIPGVETELPPVSANTIPESSLPIIGAQDVAINTVTPVSTTAALAAEVPLEPKPAVPEVVKESQEKANAAPEASAEAEGVEEKAKVEEELKEKVPEAPATSEGTAGQGTEKAQDAGLAALAATAGGAVIAAGLTAKETIEEKAAPVVNNATEAVTDAAAKNLPDAVKEKLPVAAREALDAKNKEQIQEEVSPEVPAEVKESLVEAGKSPEAAANTEAVQEKKEVEAELLKEVKPVTGTYDAVVEPTSEETKQVSPEVPAEVKESIIEAGKAPEAAANTEAVEEKKVVEAELLKEVAPVAPVEEAKNEAVAPEVPAEVKESIVEAGKAPEAAASTGAVENKKEVEAELLKETEPVPAVEETKVEEAKPAAEPAAVVAPVVQPEEAKTEAPKVEETKTEEAKPAEPAVEPVTKPEEVKAEAKPEPQAETPAVGNGTSAAENGSKAPETKPAEPAANGSSSTTAQKKKHNRLSSIFSKIKHKLSDHK